MSSGKKDPTALAAAAAALDAELARYAEVASEAQRIPLTSEKNLNRAARTIAEAAEVQEQVGLRLSALVEAINGARLRQEKSMRDLLARAEEVQRRVQALQSLMERFAALGEQAKEINALVVAAGPLKEEGAAEKLVEIDQRMGAVVDEAEALARAADEAGLAEIARQADGLRQQILAAKNKLKNAKRQIN